MALAVGLVGAGIGAYTAASNAADASALAAAPITFRPFGASGTPAAEAARYAERNGASLVRCRCPIDRSWAPRTVAVVVARRIHLPVIGSVRVSATSRATFEPIRLLGDVPIPVSE